MADKIEQYRKLFTKSPSSSCNSFRLYDVRTIPFEAKTGKYPSSFTPESDVIVTSARQFYYPNLVPTGYKDMIFIIFRPKGILYSDYVRAKKVDDTRFIVTGENQVRDEVAKLVNAGYRYYRADKYRKSFFRQLESLGLARHLIDIK